MENLEQMEAIEELLENYYSNNARKLHRMIDSILLRFGGISNKDMDDFYSLANEVFVSIMKRYDASRSFDAFLYSCLLNKIKDEISQRNRIKRTADRIAVSLDAPIDDESGLTLAEIISSDFDMDREIFKETDTYSKKMSKYLDRLSERQKEILGLTIAGYNPHEIQEALHMTEKEYFENELAIHSYRNVSVLF